MFVSPPALLPLSLSHDNDEDCKSAAPLLTRLHTGSIDAGHWNKRVEIFSAVLNAKAHEEI